MECTCRDTLRADAEALLEQADRMRRKHPRNADHARRHAMALALAVGHLRHKEYLDMTADTLTTVIPDIERDRYGRPMIVPPGGGKKVGYRRCTTFVSVLEDTWNLSRWSQRNVAVGLSERPDLLLSVAAHRDDKEKLNQLIEDAAEAAKAHAAATTGTALHALTEIVDRGLDMPVLPEQARIDITAYQAATAAIEWLAIEQGVVIDDLKVHGTPDRIGRLPDGRVVVADLKTGSVDYGMGKIAMQIAMYAHGVPYDHRGGVRTAMPDGLDLSTGIVIHLPAGTGRCDLIEVDLEAGWTGVEVARQVWEWRSRKGLSRPLPQPEIDLAGLIGLCGTVEDLRALWAANAEAWSPELTAAAKARAEALAGAAA